MLFCLHLFGTACATFCGAISEPLAVGNMQKSVRSAVCATSVDTVCATYVQPWQNCAASNELDLMLQVSGIYYQVLLPVAIMLNSSSQNDKGDGKLSIGCMKAVGKPTSTGITRIVLC